MLVEGQRSHQVGPEELSTILICWIKWRRELLIVSTAVLFVNGISFTLLGLIFSI